MEQRSALRIALGLPTPSNVPAGPSWHSHDDGKDEEDGHNGEGEDPLEGNDLIEELANSN